MMSPHRLRASTTKDVRLKTGRSDTNDQFVKKREIHNATYRDHEQRNYYLTIVLGQSFPTTKLGFGEY